VIEVSRQTQEIVWEYVDKPPQNFQIPPDLVVKTQAIDIIEVIL
jgi:hypothetical protein